jgi:HNH endonuclease
VNYLNRISYEPETGFFRWAVSGHGIQKGAIAGSSTSEGYRQVRIGFKTYRAHRLAWFLTHGEWPEGEIDHINGDRSDNRLSNLRVVDRAGNSQNRRGPQKNNRSGLLGICWVVHAKRWRAQIMVRKVMHRLGYFDSPEAAHKAYMAAKSSLHIASGG